jgi:hypothetical protein
MWTALFQILCLLCDAGAILYLFSVLADHAGIHWHGAPSLIWLSAALILLMIASVIFRFVGYPGTGLAVAALPVLLAVVSYTFVLVISLISSTGK